MVPNLKLMTENLLRTHLKNHILVLASVQVKEHMSAGISPEPTAGKKHRSDVGRRVQFTTYLTSAFGKWAGIFKKVCFAQ